MARSLSEDSECLSLVTREAPAPSSYTEELDRSEVDPHAVLKETDYVNVDVSVLSQFHEDAISQAGFGKFQWLMFFVTGLGLAADSIEILAIAYILPSAEQDLCMDSSQKGWLGGISFVGMMIGGLVWGSLADKIGRRRTLLSSLTTNAVFSIITAFMPTYGLFMVTRLCSGIGIGGSLPIVFTYYSEFLSKKNRGRHLSWLLVFWAIGGVFVAIMAWALIPRTGFNILLSENLHFSSWRVFLVVCVAPAVLSCIGLILLPESPRFLLEVGRDVEAMFVYQEIFKVNHANKPGSEYQLSDLELPTRRQTNSSSTTSTNLLAEFIGGVESFWGSFVQILCPPYTKVTLVLLIVWVTTSFGFYGMSIWFPEYIKKLHIEQFQSKADEEYNRTIQDIYFNVTMENTHFQNSYFQNVQFQSMILSHCLFEGCIFVNCTFSDVRSSKTFFRHSQFLDVLFVDTDFHDYRFQNCSLHDSSFFSTKAGCTLDYDVSFDLQPIFLENLLAQLAIIPGNIISSYVLDQLGRVKTMGTSLFLTSLSAFFIWFLESKAAVIGFETVFNFISISGWNGVDVITTETYPAHLRTTGYGFLSSISRLAAVLGSFIFGSFMNVSKAVPMLITAAVLLIGGIASVKLPETRDFFM